MPAYNKNKLVASYPSQFLEAAEKVWDWYQGCLKLGASYREDFLILPVYIHSDIQAPEDSARIHARQWQGFKYACRNQKGYADTYGKMFDDLVLYAQVIPTRNHHGAEGYAVRLRCYGIRSVEEKFLSDALKKC